MLLTGTVFTLDVIAVVNTFLIDNFARFSSWELDGQQYWSGWWRPHRRGGKGGVGEVEKTGKVVLKGVRVVERGKGCEVMKVVKAVKVVTVVKVVKAAKLVKVVSIVM
jgi:hypothetical protein